MLRLFFSFFFGGLKGLDVCGYLGYIIFFENDINM